MKMERAEEVAVAMETYPMKGGDGIYSYTNNSSWQREALEGSKEMIAEAIKEHLDTAQFSSTFRIVDLGCSVGPNTFLAMQNVVCAVSTKFPKTPQFHVFFNDHVSNDFNTLFASLPPDRHYFAAGVPGSFYDRLFPDSSIELVHSSYAIQWLSKVPDELLDEKSPAFNKGRVHYYGAPDEVVWAYAAQRAKDMERFLCARAEELVRGGMLVATVPCVPNGTPHSRIQVGFWFDLLGTCLLELAKEGIICEREVDTFNIPVYATNVDEMRELITRNGSFSIERMELSKPRYDNGFTSRGNEETCAMHVRAGFEAMISKHFGGDVIGPLFDLYADKLREYWEDFDSAFKQGTHLLIVLKRI